MDIPVLDYDMFSVDKIVINLTYLKSEGMYNAALSFFFDGDTSTTLLTEICDADRFACAISCVQLCALFFGNVYSRDVFVWNEQDEFIEQFSSDAAFEFLYPELRVSKLLH